MAAALELIVQQLPVVLRAEIRLPRRQHEIRIVLPENRQLIQQRIEVFLLPQPILGVQCQLQVFP